MKYFDCNVTRPGERGATSGWTGWFVPVSRLHLAEGRPLFYRIYLSCTSASARNTLCYINTIHKNGSRQADLA